MYKMMDFDGKIVYEEISYVELVQYDKEPESIRNSNSLNTI